MMLMMIELAPMEGIITASYRRLFKKYYGGIDRYYTPFIAANQTHTFKEREKREFLPFSEDLVPQILTNSVDDFLWAARELGKVGYKEVNLNTGCPSGTVVAKGKGAGMLKDPELLDEFFQKIFSAAESEALPAISVKTRVGMFSYDEADELAQVFSRYPFSRIIVHPRVREDYYDGKPNPDAFRCFYEICNGTDLVYNGDLNSVSDVAEIKSLFPKISGVMLGRGVLMDPSLPLKIAGSGTVPDGDRLHDFLSELWDEYASYLSGERDVLFKMKDLWNFLGKAYPDNQRELKRIKKAKTRAEYESCITGFF